MKNKNRKRLFSCFTAGLMLAATVGAFCACNGNDNPGGGNENEGGNGQTSEIVDKTLTLAKKGQPDYSAHVNDKMPIGAWNSGTGVNDVISAEVLSAAKDAGIDFLCDFRVSRHTSSKATRSYLEAVRDAGLKIFANLSGLSYSDIKEDNYGGVYEFLGEDFMMGLNVQDEPPMQDFAKHNATAAAFLADFPEKQAYINLLPNYASRGQLGADSYQEYVDSFVETATAVNHLSYDFYPLLGQMDAGYVSSSALNSLWLRSLEVMANAAKTADKDLWVFIQNMSYNEHRAPQSVADITLQNYVNMCYGARALQYFSLTSPELSDEFTESDVGMVDRNNERTDNFDYVKAANEELRTFDYVYMQYKWDNVMPLYGTTINDIATTGFDMLLTSMESSPDFKATATCDALVGQFHDDNGYKGYMVANMSDPYTPVITKVKMTFNANRVLVYANGKSEVVEIPTGEYTFNLREGAGRFIIPFNA